MATQHLTSSITEVAAIAGVICTGSFLLNAIITSANKLFQHSGKDFDQKLKLLWYFTVLETQQNVQQVLRLCAPLLLLVQRVPRSSDRGCLGPLAFQRSQLEVIDHGDNILENHDHTQNGKESIDDDLREAVIRFSNSWPHQTYLGRSTFEGGDLTLYAKHRSFDGTTYHGEIFRLDTKDNSLRLVLQKEDASILVRRGRAVLQSSTVGCSVGDIGRFATVKLCVPRNKDELAMVSELMRAALATASTCSRATDEENEMWLSE